MTVCQDIKQLRAQVSQWRNNNELVAFVPTMGNLHDGHLSLIDVAQQKASHVVVSIYVNPLQFAPGEDFASYPRTLEEDVKKLDEMGVELVFIPDTSMIYPQGEQFSTFVEVPGLSHIIEGEFRPGFFKGVATVVLKLFNIVQPDIAVFGEKDFQQLLVIRQMVKDMCLPIKILGAEIKRESDGLAMSSRNGYLSVSERQKSRLLAATLMSLRHQLKPGVSIKLAEKSCVKTLENHGFIVDYVTLRETFRLQAVSDDEVVDDKELIILAAAKIGKTRLIDNVKFVVGR